MKKDIWTIIIIVIIVILCGYLFYGYMFLLKENKKKSTVLQELRADVAELKEEVSSLSNNSSDVDTETENDDTEKQQEEQELKESFYNSLDSSVFLVDFENYNPSDDSYITVEKAESIAEKGFQRSKEYITSEGADEIESQTMEIKEVCANSYFTKMPSEGAEDVYTDISRICYVFTRENELGNRNKRLY